MKRTAIAIMASGFLVQPFVVSAMTAETEATFLNCWAAPAKCASLVDELIATSELDDVALDTELGLFATRLADELPEKRGNRNLRQQDYKAGHMKALTRIAERFESRGLSDLAEKIRNLREIIETRRGESPSPS